MVVDRTSYGRDISDIGPRHSGALEIDIEVDGLNPSKKSAMEAFRNQQPIGGHSTRFLAYVSPIIAMDTFYHSLRGNSMESVENFPVDNYDDVHGPSLVNEMS